MIVNQLLNKVSVVRYGIISIKSYFGVFKNVEKNRKLFNSNTQGMILVL